MNAKTTVLRMGVIPLVCTLSCGTDPTQNPSPSQGAAVWSEFETEDQVESVLPFMGKHGLVLNRSVVPSETDFDRLEVLIRKAQKNGVTVRLWPELTQADGRWPSVSTRRIFIPFFNEVMDFVESRKLPVDTLYVDLEPSLVRGRELLKALQQPEANSLQALLGFYEAKVYDPDFENARDDFRRMVDEAHARGFKVFMTTIPFILDDFADGDPSLQRSLESPVEGIDWDEYSFQVYTTMLSGLYGIPVGSGLVFDYARTARELFGEKAALDLGLFTTTPDVFTGTPGYLTPLEMEADVLAAVAAGVGVERIHFFSMEGILKRPDPSPWFQWDLSKALPPPTDAGGTFLRRILQSVDQQYQ